MTTKGEEIGRINASEARELIDTLKSMPRDLVSATMASIVDQMLAEATTWRDLDGLLTAEQLADMEDLERRKPARDPSRHDDIMLRTAKICVEATWGELLGPRAFHSGSKGGAA